MTKMIKLAGSSAMALLLLVVMGVMSASSGAQAAPVQPHIVRPASLQIGDWIGPKLVVDCAGNGCLHVSYKTRFGMTTGFKLWNVEISSDSGGLLYTGIDGHTLECWNQNNVIKWSKDGTETDLDKGHLRGWDPGQTWDTASVLKCSWHFDDVFIGSGDQPECVKISADYNSDTPQNCIN